VRAFGIHKWDPIPISIPDADAQARGHVQAFEFRGTTWLRAKELAALPRNWRNAMGTLLNWPERGWADAPAIQPELGLLSERRPRTGAAYSGHPPAARKNLSRTGEVLGQE